MDPVARLHEEIAARKELNAIEEEIAAFVARVDACEHELLTRLREFDAKQGWVGRATSCSRWLSWRTGLSMQAARDRVRVARALGGLPLIDAAMRRGELSYSKVRALTRIATRRTEWKWVETARRVAADHLETLCRERRHLGRRAAVGQRVDRRFVRRRNTPHGMVRIEIQLPPEEADVVWEAIAAATASAGASAEASPEVVQVSEEKTQVQSSARAGTDAPEGVHGPRAAEEALRAVRAELEAAARARSQPNSRAPSSANDAPDLEDRRAAAIVKVAESFVRRERSDEDVEPPRPP